MTSKKFVRATRPKILCASPKTNILEETISIALTGTVVTHVRSSTIMSGNTEPKSGTPIYREIAQQYVQEPGATGRHQCIFILISVGMSARQHIQHCNIFLNTIRYIGIP